MEELKRRHKLTTQNLKNLSEQLKDATDLYQDRACVYATGSYGRLEATEDSDLDLFIVGLPLSAEEESKEGAELNRYERKLNRLDEICLKAELIMATKKLDLPEFDGDGEYLRHYTSKQIVEYLGKPDDDVVNTFTARLLLLLESQPLLGQKIYDDVIEDVIVAYWRDYEDHSEEFVPTFFVNDVLRLWRTFCVNYEARTRTVPESDKLKRRVKNYKLKHNRMLTCFSAILNLLVVYREASTVRPTDVVDIVGRTPTGRLEWILGRASVQDSHDRVKELLEAYDAFLKTSKVGTEALMDTFRDRKKHREYMAEAGRFGNKMFSALSAVGSDSSLLRQLMV